MRFDGLTFTKCLQSYVLLSGFSPYLVLSKHQSTLHAGVRSLRASRLLCSLALLRFSTVYSQFLDRKLRGRWIPPAGLSLPAGMLWVLGPSVTSTSAAPRHPRRGRAGLLRQGRRWFWHGSLPSGGLGAGAGEGEHFSEEYSLPKGPFPSLPEMGRGSSL